MVTGLISFTLPEYSPISSSVSEVRSSSSRRHCLAAKVLVTKINVAWSSSAITPAPTSVFPAPQGRHTTPDPAPTKRSMARSW
ncbi:MAG: Uncharacterised protein [Cellulomonadaceae bacterium TMED98]|nr:MAG: Uncharacterised protein [Cellulomonadaceae bacterium TMED98]